MDQDMNKIQGYVSIDSNKLWDWLYDRVYEHWY
jgi:hypothetical protein